MKSHTLLAEIKILEAGHYNRALLPNAACLQGCSDLSIKASYCAQAHVLLYDLIHHKGYYS